MRLGPGFRGLPAPSPLLVIGAILLVGLSGGTAGWEAAPCPSLPGQSFLGVAIEAPLCGLSLNDLGTAVIHAGPLVWGICLAPLLLGVTSLLGTTGLGLALRALVRAVRDWFTDRLLPPAYDRAVPPTTSSGSPLVVRVADLRSLIGQRPLQHRGPPIALSW